MRRVGSPPLARSALVNGPAIPTDQHPYFHGLAVDARWVMYVADSGTRGC
jgi:hypothetical protein